MTKLGNREFLRLSLNASSNETNIWATNWKCWIDIKADAKNNEKNINNNNFNNSNNGNNNS